MRFRRPLVSFIGLTVMLLSAELWFIGGLAAQKSRIVFTHGGSRENLSNHPVDDTDPDWSPDGTKIAFVSRRTGEYQIYVMDADGKNQIRLTDGLETKGEPDWSPDGQQIAFVSWKDGGNEIYVMGADGQGLERVTHDLAGKWSPSFSPDGQRIAYYASHEGFFHIHVVGADGKNLKRLTHDEKNHWGATWSLDGQTIAYAISNDGFPLGAKIHLMTADGKYLKQLSKVRDGMDYQPDFNHFQQNHNLGWAEETRAQPPIACEIAF